MVRLLESRIEERLVKSAKKMGVVSLKLELRHDTAWPDRLFLIPGGRPVFVELKREGEKPGPKQRHRLQQLVRLGYDAVWFDAYDAALLYLTSKVGAARRAARRGEVLVEPRGGGPLSIAGQRKNKRGSVGVQKTS